MIIDIVMNGEQLMRYDSDVAPRIGETISCLRPIGTYEVIFVNHLIKKANIGLPSFRHELITVEVI